MFAPETSLNTSPVSVKTSTPSPAGETPCFAIYATVPGPVPPARATAMPWGIVPCEVVRDTGFVPPNAAGVAVLLLMTNILFMAESVTYARVPSGLTATPTGLVPVTPIGIAVPTVNVAPLTLTTSTSSSPLHAMKTFVAVAPTPSGKHPVESVNGEPTAVFVIVSNTASLSTFARVTYAYRPEGENATPKGTLPVLDIDLTMVRDC